MPNSSAPIDGFRIARSVDDDQHFTQIAQLPADRTHAFVGEHSWGGALQPDKQYFFQITAYKEAIVSQPSKVSVRSMPALPLAPDAAVAVLVTGNDFAGPTKYFDVSWRDNANNEDGFIVSSTWILTGSGYPRPVSVTPPAEHHAAMPGTGVRAHHRTELIPQALVYLVNYQVQWTIRAFNQRGQSIAPGATRPNAPGRPTVTQNEDGGFTVTWADNSNNEDEFWVLRNDGNGSEVIAVLPAGTTTFTDPPDDEGVNEYYVIGSNDVDFAKSEHEDTDLPTLSISASDATAAEPGQDPVEPGEFLISNAHSTKSATAVLEVTGHATNGVDYDQLQTSVSIPPSDREIALKPKRDDKVEGLETVNYILKQSRWYRGSGIATVYIDDSTEIDPDLNVIDLDHTQNDVTAYSNGAKVLYIGKTLTDLDEDPFGIELVAEVDGARVPHSRGEEVLWNIDGDFVTPASAGDFSDVVQLDLVPFTTADTVFAITLGYDSDGDGVLDNSEVTRHVNVHVIEVENLLVSDAGREMPSDPQTSDSDAIPDVYIADVDDSEFAGIKIDSSFQPTGEAAHVVFSVVGNGSNADELDRHDLAGEPPVVELDSRVNRDYEVRLGVDWNSNGKLDAQEAILLAMRIHTFTVKFVKTYSDQLPGQNSNYLPGNAGVVDYILMGTRTNDIAYARADLEIAGDSTDLRTKLHFAFVGTPLENFSAPDTVFTLDQNKLSVHGAVPDAPLTEYAAQMRMVWGIDGDGNGSFSAGEVQGISPHLFKVVGEVQEKKAYDNIQWTIAGGNLLGPYARNVLYAFSNGFGLGNGAVNTASTITLGQDDRLGHHVGVNFANGTGPVNLATFNWATSALPNAIVNSAEMKALVLQCLSAPGRNHEVEYAFNAVGPDQPLTFDWPLGATGINFANHDDLHFALGRASLTNCRVRVEVTPRPESVTVGGRETYTLELTALSVNGDLDDVTDYLYNDGLFFAGAGAAMQAKYSTSTILPASGRVGKIMVKMNNDLLMSHSFGEFEWIRP